MEEKAQGALEYLLLIAGAVLVAAIVIVLLSGLTGTPGNAANTGATHIVGGYHALGA